MGFLKMYWKAFVKIIEQLHELVHRLLNRQNYLGQA